MKLLVLNGPNLNLLGTREPDIYGAQTLEELERQLVMWGEKMGAQVEAIQSNHEGVIIDNLQRGDVDGIVLNAAAYTHTSRALADTIKAISTPVVEVHISNVKERESWRSVSFLEEVCEFSIFGRGSIGYRDALRHLVNRAEVAFETISYGAGKDNVGEIRVSGDTLVVLVHGGFWRREWARDTTESAAVDLTKRGMTTWNIEYRRLGDGGGWPDSPNDVLEALDHIPELGVKPRRVVVVGHSAGGNMAMWAAQRSMTPIDEVIALAPLVDLERHARSQMYGAFEAQQLLDQGAPPRVEPGDVRTFLIHGETDSHVPIGHSADLARDRRLELLTTATGHFELLDPSREHWDQLVAEVIG
ncbi:MAG: type II 3-dehydroquinate dehydratase [Acidimicrobiia bacterium]